MILSHCHTYTCLILPTILTTNQVRHFIFIKIQVKHGRYMHHTSMTTNLLPYMHHTILLIRVNLTYTYAHASYYFINMT